tara:strand:- start:1587 stop:2963 length:1377 start_codon:yes stop_codon:yes gene_type:complete
MKKKQLILILFYISNIYFSCSPEDKEIKENNPPKNFQISSINFEGLNVTIDWNDAIDEDKDIVYYSLYVNDELISESTNSEGKLRTSYNKFYTGKIIATDKNGGTTELNFNFDSPLSKIVFYQTGSDVINAYDLIENKILWEKSGGLLPSFCIVNDRIFSGSDKIQALDIVTGEVKWSSNSLTYYDHFRDIVIQNNYAYAYSTDNELFCIDLKTKEKIWSRHFYEYEGPMGIDESQIYIANRNDYDLYALNNKTGNILWQYVSYDRPYSYIIKSNPLLVDNIIYVGDNYYFLRALDKNTGELLWQRKLDDAIYASPSIYKNMIIVASNTTIYAINKNGTIQWTWKHSDVYNFNSSPIVSNDKIYAPLTGNGDGKIICLDANSGIQLWSASCGPNPSSPVVYDKKLFFGDWNKKFYALNTSNGNTDWEITTKEYVSGSSTVVVGEGQEIYYSPVSPLKN